jgi:hypothetical protein
MKKVNLTIIVDHEDIILERDEYKLLNEETVTDAKYRELLEESEKRWSF